MIFKDEQQFLIEKVFSPRFDFNEDELPSFTDQIRDSEENSYSNSSLENLFLSFTNHIIIYGDIYGNFEDDDSAENHGGKIYAEFTYAGDLVKININPKF